VQLLTIASKLTGNTAKSYSSSRSKFYEITYDPIASEIMSNDNSSYFKGELGYPSIAYLMKVGVLSFDQKLADILKGIQWKDINQKFKNDFSVALDHILSSKTEEERKTLEVFAQKVDKEIEKLQIGILGKKQAATSGLLG
jgi:hypothetical protein